MKFIKKHWLVLIVILVGVFLRLYKFDELFLYTHDHDLNGWIIRDIVENKHLRLIGQETTNKGVFIGPLWYYALIPFYLLTNWDPIGGVLLPIIVAIGSISSIYFIFTKVFSKKAGLIGATIYSLSFYTVFTDREIVPTTPVMLWTMWYFYALFLVYKGKQKMGFLLTGVLFALIWHFNLALAIVTPLIFLSFLFSRKKINFKYAGIGIGVCLVLSLPLILFELKHGFIQVNSIIASLTTDKAYIEGTAKGFAKFDRLMQLVYKNTDTIFVSPFDFLPQKLTFWVLVLMSGVLLLKKKIDLKIAALMASWLILFAVFFTLNPINLSEYYLNGMNVIWIAIVALFLAKFVNKYIVMILLGVFSLANINQIINVPVNASGYVERKQIVEFIKADAIAHSYPCISVSYITDPGLDFGYRYFFYLAKMHVNLPKSGSPVYTIVFPHSKVDRIDRSFGALGLVLPDYGRYTKEEVEKSCQGENANLTYPLFGFTN